MFDGESIVCDATGKLVGQGAAFSEDFLIFDTEANTCEVREVPESGSAAEVNMNRNLRRLACLLTLWALPVLSHDFWIEPSSYQVPAGGKVTEEIG